MAAASNGHLAVIELLMRDQNDQMINIEEEYLFKALNAHMDAQPALKYSIEKLGIVFIENTRGLSQDFILYLHQLMDQEDGLLRIPIFSIIHERPLDFLRTYCHRGFPEIRIVDPTVSLPDNWLQRLLEILSLSLTQQKLIAGDERDRFSAIQLPIAKTDNQKEALNLFAQLLTHLHKLSKESGTQIKIPYNTLLQNILFSIGKNPEIILESSDFSQEGLAWKQSVLEALNCIDQGIGQDLREALQKDCESVIRDIFESDELD